MSVFLPLVVARGAAEVYVRHNRDVVLVQHGQQLKREAVIGLTKTVVMVFRRYRGVEAPAVVVQMTTTEMVVVNCSQHSLACGQNKSSPRRVVAPAVVVVVEVVQLIHTRYAHGWRQAQPEWDIQTS